MFENSRASFMIRRECMNTKHEVAYCDVHVFETKCSPKAMRLTQDVIAAHIVSYSLTKSMPRICWVLTPKAGMKPFGL